ncbi:MAG: OmpA family protein, partial [Myxococcales bacterium]|nr:OmpA family protein [Myxococcales bacterium]
EAERAKPFLRRHAPRGRSWELGLFGGVATPSRGLDLHADTVPWKRYARVAGDVGVRGGYYFLSFLGLEGELGLLPGRVAATGAGALMYTARIQPVLQLPFWRLAPFATVGLGLLGVGSDPSAMGNDVDLLFSYGGGLKLYVSRNIGLRLDVRTNLSQKYVDPDAADTEEYLLGLVVRLGPRPRPPAPPPDTDRDGFLDEADACPTEPGVAPDGCPIRDADGDGFLDDVDACPTEPGVEPDGCPIRDTDEDGLLDDVDQCVTEPETRNGFEDADGCPDAIPEEVERFTGAIRGIYFQSGKANIRKKSERVLAAAAKVLGDYPSLRVEISGHTDDQGSRDFNMRLSAARAASVRDWLVAHGIDASRLTTRGAGPDEPVDVNTTKQGRAANRRIEFRLIE